MPVAGAMAENATLFFVYNKCQDLLIATSPFGVPSDGLSDKAWGKKRALMTPELAIAAAAAGACASFILWVLRHR